MKSNKTGVSMGSTIVKVPKCKRDYSRKDYNLSRKERKIAKIVGLELSPLRRLI